MTLTIQFRGLLTSCNYACNYCPFAKRREPPGRQLRDRQSLERFTAWLSEQSSRQWNVLFTPWGEALVRAWYRAAIARLSHAPHLRSVAVQTNLSCGLNWIRDCQVDRLAFSATYHPSECDRRRFVQKVRRLHEWGVQLSVGAVGVPQHIQEIEALRSELPTDVYLWVNAQQPRRRRYTSEEVARLTAIDPHFSATLTRQRSLGLPCRSGEQSFTVDGSGDMRRCHFVGEVIGNIYRPDWDAALRPRDCPKLYCGCYLGLSQLPAASPATQPAVSLRQRFPNFGG